MTDLSTAAAPTPEPEPADKAAAGSELARLFHEHNASLVQLLRARLRSDQEARDVAQEAYVRLLQLDRMDAVSYLRTYLFRTAFNIATDRLRSAKVRQSSSRDPVFDVQVNEITPDRVALADEALSQVAAALEQLAPKPRYAFLLHRFAGVEIAEVATRMGVSDRMVRKYITQALLCCRQALEGGSEMKTGGQS